MEQKDGNKDKALEGIKVIDLTHYVAGPYCTKHLAGLGAEVIKVEKPDSGDGARKLSPFLKDDPHPEKSGLFLYLNTNKKGVTLNLKNATGVRIFKELVRTADVLVENFKPDFLPTLGLDYNVLKENNPKLVMTSISNFGQTGPYRDWKASEITEYAMGGLMYITGEPDREPMKIGTYMAQYIAGQYAFVNTLGALFSAQMTGEGHHIDISIMECNAALLEFQMPQYGYRGYVSQRVGQASEKGHPHGMLPCKDGWVALSIWPPGLYKAVAELTGIPELAEEKFSSSGLRLENKDEYDAYLLSWLMEHNKEDIVKAWQGIGLPASWIHDVGELLEAPQLKERSYFVEVDHPVAGNLIYPGAPFRMSRTPYEIGRAPLLGEHNEEVYCENLDFSKNELVKLRAAGVI